MQPSAFYTRSPHDPRIPRILAAAINAANPETLVSDALARLPLPPHRKLFLLGIGKAAEGMTFAVSAAFGHFDSALVVTKHAIGPPQPRIKVIEGGHPIPDARSIAAGREILRFLSRLSPDDLLICCISGGGSALVTAPAEGISLGDLEVFTAQALAAGARINEINSVRRAVDQLKDGGLARAAKASILSLILSDVIEDDPASVASGPTMQNPTSPAEVLDILQKYSIQVSPALVRILRAGRADSLSDVQDRVTNVVVGNCTTAVEAAAHQARLEGLESRILTTAMQGEARDVGLKLASDLLAALPGQPRPFCILAGGETTVTLGRGPAGAGGRNQELALGAVAQLAGCENSFLLSLATDGEDGPTDAAGAVVDGTTGNRAAALGLDPADFLERHDSYHFFAALGDQLKPGPTGTNVNDIMLVAAL